MSVCVLRSKLQQCYDGFDGSAKFVEESLMGVSDGSEELVGNP